MAKKTSKPAAAPPAPKVRANPPYEPKRFKKGTSCRLLLRPGAAPLEAELPEGGTEHGAPAVSAALSAADAKKLHLSAGRVQRGRISLCSVAGPSTDGDVFPRFEV